MATKSDVSWCPFCGGDKCEHFAGWTEDGRWLVGRSVPHHPGDSPILETDRIIKTGVSARVYRKEQPLTRDEMIDETFARR